MSTKSGVPAAAAADPPIEAIPLSEPAPTVTRYQQLAEEFMAALNEVTSIIPKLEAAHVSTSNFVRSHQSVPIEFLATAVAGVERNVELQNLNKLDLVIGRDTLQFLEAFKPVLDVVTAFGRDLQFTMNSRKASLAADALQVYYIAKGLVRDPGSAPLAAVVANLKRDLNRPGRPKVSPAAKKAALAAANAQSAPQEVKVS
jgi:hypothetical protein